MSEVPRSSPYLGLVPYDEQDAAYFFGREKETRLILANLFASPLTLLYGPSGVGKSSILRAGVAHSARLRGNILLVVCAQWQGDSLAFLKGLIADHGPSDQPRDGVKSLADCICSVEAKTGKRLMIIMDQFDEYFLYHPGETEFDEELCLTLSQPLASCSFLISLREDSLAGLDRYEGRIEGLFDNYLRIEHLDAVSARKAIERPLEQFNVEQGQSPPFSIEPDLVKGVIEQVQASALANVQARYSVLPRTTTISPQDTQPVDGLVEAPYLQLVMTRLWNEERRLGSNVLRLSTLQHLGGAERIVTTHLDRVIDDLSDPQRATCAKIFHFLVTPSGSKIAHSLSDLARYAQLPIADVEEVVERLSGPARILRSVAHTTNKVEDTRYEIYHDVLARSVQEWRGRYLQVQARREAEQEARVRQTKRRRKALLILLAVFLALAVVAGIVYTASVQAQSARRQERIDNGRKAESSYDEGKDLLRRGEYDKALASLSTAFGLYQLLEEKSKQLVVLIDTGRVFALKNDPENAGKSYNQARSLAVELGDIDSQGIALERLGALWETSNQIDRAMEFYAEAEKAFSDAGDQQSAARMLERLGAQAEASGDLTLALATYRAAVTNYTIAGDPTGRTRARQARERVEELVPWGYLIDLQTGESHALRGAKVSIGRSVPAEQVQNDVVADDPRRFVSRHHMEIRRNLQAEDMRSLNGTTINAASLPYGHGRTLLSGDVVVLGGARAFLFLDRPPAGSLAPPPGAWGIFISGATRKILYLEDPQYSLRLTNHGVALAAGTAPDAVLLVRKVDENMELFAPAQEWKPRVQIKESDYDYPWRWLKTGAWLQLDGSPPPILFQKEGTAATGSEPAIQLVLFE